MGSLPVFVETVLRGLMPSGSASWGHLTRGLVYYSAKNISEN